MEGTDVVDANETNEWVEGRQETENTTVDVSAHRSSPDRVVFTEDGNCDGWISIDADLTRSVER